MDILDEKGREAYKALIKCVNESLEQGSSEYAVICALPLIKLAEIESANYFGGAKAMPYDYNTAWDVSKKALVLAGKEGIPTFLEKGEEEIKKVVAEF